MALRRVEVTRFFQALFGNEVGTTGAVLIALSLAYTSVGAVGLVQQVASCGGWGGWYDYCVAPQAHLFLVFLPALVFLAVGIALVWLSVRRTGQLRRLAAD